MGSIRWRLLLAFLMIIGLSFALMSSRLTGYVSNYLYEQRIRQDSLSVERLASTAAPLFVSASGDAMNDALLSGAGELGGRLLAIDLDGKVQYDSHGQLPGTRLQLPEVLAILTGGQTSAYGIHHSSATETSGEEWVAYCAVPMLSGGETVGVLLYVSTVTELAESMNQVQRELGVTFLLAALAGIAAALLFSHVLTAPITRLTRTIQRMGGGDLSVRVPVRGSTELRRLAESYNTMAEQLESLDQSRNQFVSNASHELKTPLATMKIMLENLIYQPEMPEELRAEFLTDIDHEIDRLTGIVTDLLTLTRMDNHKMELKTARMNLSELAEETLRLLRPTAEKRRQRLSGKIAPDIWLQADRSKLGQVLYNLTENAIKYTPDGGEVTLGLQAKGKAAVITVKDTGIGIRP